MRHSTLAGDAVKVILIPSVFRIASAFPTSQVSLPFSRSMMNRIPVPEVRARSFCVTPSFLRVSRISLPICAAVYLKGQPPKYYRTGTLYHFTRECKENITVQEVFSSITALLTKIFPLGDVMYRIVSKYLAGDPASSIRVLDMSPAPDKNPSLAIAGLAACPFHSRTKAAQ